VIAEKVKLQRSDLEAFRAFVADMNARENYQAENLNNRLSEIEECGEAWVVSELGPIEEGKLKLVTGLYVPVGGADGYDATQPVTLWYPDYATGNYENQLTLAHERKVRQLHHFIAKQARV